MTQQPTVGRIVHYQAYGTPAGEFPSKPRAAIVTEIVELEEDEAVPSGMPLVGLCVMNPSGLFFNRDVPFSETPMAGCWSWPPRT
jgi:hypothetical protein